MGFRLKLFNKYATHVRHIIGMLSERAIDKLQYRLEDKLNAQEGKLKLSPDYRSKC